MKFRSYSELRRIDSLEKRFEYLALRGSVGEATFGFDRWMNQQFYRSAEWKRIRDHVIVRDNACDLGIPGYDIHSRLYIHHLRPITVEDFKNGDDSILDPEFLICTTHQTHNAIHYGDARLLPKPLIQRRPGDTKLW